MRALRIENGELRLAEIGVPDRPEEALVRVTLAGICNTDLEIVRGYAGFSGTLGHEFVGVVERSPDPSQVGRRVVGEINAGCGRCELCLGGDARHCAERTVLGIHGRDGAFAEYVSLPPGNLLEVPDGVSDRQAVFVEPLAAACSILEQVEIGPGHRTAVIGDGKLGQLISRVLARTGCDLVLIGKHAGKLELAARSGVNTLDAARASEGLEGRFDFVVEASGNPSGFELAMKLVRPRGTIILKSTFHGKLEIDTARIVVDEISIVGSRCGRFSDALELLADGAFDLEPLIAATCQLDRGIEAMAAARRPGTLKVLLCTQPEIS
ncbi:MAG: alcohol dehydrogenase catalytic domain-containing protein [Acidobacteriota bacterium]|nr:MAG: alcohol dehydrogenase catalytic domain-containing protein [Acidobacteriota bacterium]